MVIHLMSRYWWVFEEGKGPMSLPFVARCGANLVGKNEGADWTVRDRDRDKNKNDSGFHDDVVPTCDACILLHWSDPIGTEDVQDHIYK